MDRTRTWSVVAALALLAGGTHAAASVVAPNGSTRYVYDAAGNLSDVIDTSRDVNHCGQLGTRCPSITGLGGETACVNGACGATVNGAFVDVWTDPARCGAALTGCRVPTNGVATCTGGSCGMTCYPGFVPAGADCVDLLSSRDHCGAVDHACAVDGACRAGVCAVTGTPVVQTVNGVAAPGVAFRTPAVTGIRVEGTSLDAVMFVDLEDWGPDSVGTDVAAPAFVGGASHVPAWRSPTSLVIPYAAIDDLPLRRWHKLRLQYFDQGIWQQLLVDIPVSLDDQVPAAAPAPVITGVSVLEIRGLQRPYDPRTGFLPLNDPTSGCGLDPTLRHAPRAVLANDRLATEYPVLRVTPEGVYLPAGLRDVGENVGDEGMQAQKITLVFDHQADGSEPVNLAPLGFPSPLNCVSWRSWPQIGGLILRGSNLLADSTLAAVDSAGNLVSSKLGQPIFLEERIVIRPSALVPGTWNEYALIDGILGTEASIVVSSPRGSGATPSPVRWFSVPVVEGVGPGSFVTYDQVMTLTGRFFTNIQDVAFSWAGLVEHLRESRTSPPGPGQFRVVDEHHIEVAVSSAPGVVPRQLASRCTSDGPITDVFPGTRWFTVTNASGSGSASTNALDPAGPSAVAPPVACGPPPSGVAYTPGSGAGPNPGGGPQPGAPNLTISLPARGGVGNGAVSVGTNGSHF